jgi:hypothetical protein
MDPLRFDELSRRMGLRSPRRPLVSALAGGVLGLTAMRPLQVAARKGKHKHKTKKEKPNAFGCLEVGDDCKRGDQCCSGICEGKNGKRRCRAHDTGPCDQKTPGFCESVGPAGTRCKNQANCFCLRTTAGSHVCGTSLAPSACAECKKDADCVAQGFPPGTTCAVFSEGNCAGLCEEGTACIAPCGATPAGS